MVFVWVYSNSPGRLYEWTRNGGLPAIRFDGGFKVPKPAGMLDEYMKRLTAKAKEYGTPINMTIA